MAHYLVRASSRLSRVLATNDRAAIFASPPTCAANAASAEYRTSAAPWSLSKRDRFSGEAASLVTARQAQAN